MSDTVTTAYALTKPEIGASEDTWGTKINTDLDTLDTVVNAIGGKTAAATLSYADAAKIATTATGVDVTGNVVVSGTVDGVDIAARDAILTSTTVTADAALPKAGGTMTGDLSFGDNDKAIFGAGSDLQIYHDGSHSRIDEQGTGVLFLQTNGNNIQLNKGTSENMLVANVDGSVDLYYDNSKKLATTATGIDVTGTAVTDGLTVAGNLSVDGGTIKLDGNYPVGTGNVALGNTALDSNVSGASNTAIGADALTANTTASNNTAVGYQAGDANTTGGNNVFNGYRAGYSNTTGVSNVATGLQSFFNSTTGSYNVAIGQQALNSNTTASNNTAVGYQAAYANTTASYLAAVGYRALTSNTTGAQNTAMGYEAGVTNTTGGNLSAFGLQAGYSNTTGSGNTFIGANAARANSTGSYNTAIGTSALYANTTSGSNTAVGYQAGYTNQTGIGNVFIGKDSGRTSNVSGNAYNTVVGSGAGYSLTTGISNTFIGSSATVNSSGYYVTSGSKNTILGGYNGNQGGLDIRTSSNNIVLSDGDGNPRWNYVAASRGGVGGWGTQNAAADMSGSNTGATYGTHLATDGFTEFKRTTGPIARFALQGATGTLVEWRQNSGLVGSVSTNGSSTAYNTSSDYRLKENVVYDWDATTRLKQLKPARFNFITEADRTVDGFLAHEAQAVVPEAVHGIHNEVDDDGAAVMQGIDQSKLVPLLVKTIQELEARITALEGA